MSPLMLLVSVIGALAALSAASPASASEAFLCENGRIAYVEFGALELAKKTDPCIAGYFGGTVEEPNGSRSRDAGIRSYRNCDPDGSGSGGHRDTAAYPHRARSRSLDTDAGRNHPAGLREADQCRDPRCPLAARNRLTPECFKSGVARKASFTGGCEISGGWVASSGVSMSKRGANSALRRDGFAPLLCLCTAIACLFAATDTRAAEHEADAQPWPSFAEARLEIADMAAEGSVAAAVAAEGQPKPQPVAGFSFATAQIQIAIEDATAGAEAGILVAEAMREAQVPNAASPTASEP